MKTFIKILVIVLMTALIGICSDAQAQSFDKKKYAKRIAKAQKKHLKHHGEPAGCHLISNPFEGQYTAHRRKQRRANRA
jgi:hypothetical protein